MASVLDLVKHYQHSIEKYGNDEQKILKCIDKLYNLDVKVQHLQETGVGRTVNALRKEPGDVGQAARALVYKWKMMVAAEESDQEDHNNDSAGHNGHENEREKSYDNYSSESKGKHNRHDKSDRSHNPEKEDKSQKHTNGDYVNKRKYQSSEEEEPDTKRSKYSSAKDNGYKIKTETKIKSEPIESEDSHDDSSQSGSESENTFTSEEERKPDVKRKPEKDEKVENHRSSHSTSSKDKYKHESYTKTSKDKRSDYSEERHSSEKSKDKSHQSHTHKSSKEHERSHEKREKEHRSEDRKESSKHTDKHKSSSHKHRSSESVDRQKSNSSSIEKHKSSSSADKHKSSSQTDKHKSSSAEKHKSHSEKSSTYSHQNSSAEKSSSKLDKDKHKHSSEKENSEKHKSKETSSSSSSSSKDKHNPSSKEKSKDKSSSREKDYSKSERKHSSKDREIKHDKKKSDSDNDKSSRKSKHKSSSSSKSKTEEPKKKHGEDSDDGIDCGSGASFAEALGMISPAKPKKRPLSKDNTMSPNDDLSPASLLAPTAKLAPLPMLEITSLPEINPNYRPRPPPKFLPHFTDEDAISAGISSKNQRTKVYSGNKVFGKITTLYEMCVQVLQEHIDALEYTGGVPYEILKPVVDKATPQQLFVLEHYNPYLMEDTDHLWQKFCEKNFRNKKRQEMETWREMYMRCQEEQEIKLKSLTANIKIAQEAKKAPIKQTKMAYVDSVVKPPRNVLKKQAQHGTAFAATASPAARVASLAAAPNVLKGGRAAPMPVTTSSSSFKPKKAPLMAKALQFMRGRKR